MDWLKVIQDPKTYPNESVITAPNGENFTLGQLREAWVARENEISRREQELNKSVKSVNDARVQLGDLYQVIETEKNALAAREKELTAKLNNAKASEEDPYLGPALAEIKSLKDERVALLKDIESIKKNQLEMADIYLNDQWNRDMAEIGDKLPQGMSRESLLKFAVENKLTDGRGLPSIKKAFDKVTEPERTEKARNEAIEEGRRKEREDQAVRSISHKQSHAPKSPVVGGHKGFGNMREAFAAAASDGDISRLIAGGNES